MTANHHPDFAAQAPVPSQDPIAIIGMACRFPGSNNVSDFWRQLLAGENAVVEGPPGSVIGRVGQNVPDANPVNDAVRFGAFIQDIDQFDAEFFRISPIEAQMLDPQHRLMLETTWQALEDAAIDPERLKGSRTGVYAGISNYDYRELAIDSPETAEAAGGLYAVTGNTLNTAIGRVSFALGLEGPSMAIDTACSSSLVSIHQAIEGLNRRETDLAIAGGVQLFLSGRSLELRANAGMLSPSGQCKTFDASADGFVCGEGCGLVVLKRLSEAESDGDRIWAVIRGSSVNQDGASQGLTVPSGPSQQRAIQGALSSAGISASDVDYLEAHGTGTVVGDPIELNAAAAVYGIGRGDSSPLLIGSVKTNIGHLGAAAGAAGLIKSVLAMRHGVIPRHLNFKDPNPRIDLNNLPVRVTDVVTDWPAHPGRLPLAGVNSFGWSGTNAHVVVEGYGEPVSSPKTTTMSPPSGSYTIANISLPEPGLSNAENQLKFAKRDTRFLPLSGKSPEALRAAASEYLSWLDRHVDESSPETTAADPTLSDMAWTASVGRSHFSSRAGIVFSNVSQLRERLKRLADGENEANSQAALQAKKVAFVFTGQGSQWVGMGKTLYEREPVFRAVLDQCDEMLFEQRGVSLLDVMFGLHETEGLLDEPTWTQPAIYSMECAMAALWKSVGIEPNVVIGHSLGEIAASQAAGVFSLRQGLMFASARGTLLGATRSDGAMAAVFAPAPHVAAVVADHNANSDDVGVSVAVDNGLQQVVSGPSKDIEAVLAMFEAAEIKVRRLKRSPAYHSALMEPALDELEAAVRDITGTPPPPSVPLISDLDGRLIGEHSRMDADYWRRHAREPVAFRSCVETLAEMGVDVVVEIGPHVILGPVVAMTWPESASTGSPVVLQSLRRPPRDPEEPVLDPSGGFVQAVAEAYEAGLDIKCEGLFAGEARRKISVPFYQFQRKHHWVSMSKRRRQDAGHPLLGTRHESPRGEVMFETEMFPSDPAWMVDHLVYDRIVAPGGMYGAMAVSASLSDGSGPAIVDEMQTHNALIFEDETPEDPSKDFGRKLQFVLDGTDQGSGRRFEIFSKGAMDDNWTLHAEGNLVSDASDLEKPPPIDLDETRARLEYRDPVDFYSMRSADAIYLGPSYHTLKAIWAREGESLGELALQDSVDTNGIEMHPLLLDGCFQVLSLARHLSGVEQGAVYMPFGWERLWVAGPMPERIVCHATLRQPASRNGTERASSTPPEVITGDVNFYSTDGAPIGALKGFTVKRATRAALLSAKDGLKDILYEVVWRERPLNGSIPSAEFLVNPETIVKQSRSFADYLSDEGVEAQDRIAFLADMERLSQSYALSALESLGWERRSGERIAEEDLRRQLRIIDDHQRLLGRLLAILSEAKVLSASKDGFVVEVGAQDTLPHEYLADPDSFAQQLRNKYPHGVNELGLLSRCGSSLADVLQGLEDPLGLLFSDEGPSAADLYLKAPASRAANNMLGDAVATAISKLPEDRPLRILEVGAGTGSATESILPLLLSGRFEYTFTDISAGFFTQAEVRLAEYAAPIEYRTLNIEADPAAQGFDAHGYDLLIAANVLHATRDLGETLAHCRDLLAPSGQLIALEGLQRRAYQDLTFGLLDGWWRFSDAYRPDHALGTVAIWTRALNDTGFSNVSFIGPTNPDAGPTIGSSVILARGPAEVALSPGTWVIASDEGGAATELAAELTARGQTVVLASPIGGPIQPSQTGADVITVSVDTTQRGAWQTILGGLPKEMPLKGVVHMMALDGHGAGSTTQEMAEDVTRVTASALALVQGIAETGVTPTEGVWFVTRGAQVIQQDFIDRIPGELAGATLWGFGKVMAGEVAHLQPRLVDLDPMHEESTTSQLIDELLSPDPETHIAYRAGSRHAARLVRGVEDRRLTLPEGAEWGIGPEDPGAGLTALRTKPRPRQALEPGEMRIAVESMGLNFADVVISMGVVEYNAEIGREVYGRVLETAQDVKGFSVGDPVVGMGFGGFTPEMVIRADLAVQAPDSLSAAALSTIPICFVTAELAFKLAELKPGERVLIHAGTGGVGLAAIQVAKAAGAEIFVTASTAKQTYLRSLGVEHVFDTRQTKFGEEILKATGGEGVHVVLNSLTGEGFIEASLSCLARGGRFVEIAKLSIYTEEEMSAIRPDVDYHILDVETLKEADPSRPGDSLSRIMACLSSGDLTPLPHTVWPLTEIGTAMDVMRDARHIGKNVLRMPPLARGAVHADRTYLVTGGMGGIGCEVARWLSENGAETIVLNGRRDPEPIAEEVIRELRGAGVDVRTEIADVTDFVAVDKMLARIDETLPPLGGVIHSVGVLSDGVIENQTWERFEQVMWPKVLGAWHLHQATRDKDLDMFILFSSVTGVVGNAGQANHAAANAFLDQLAAHRRLLGLPGQAIAWGAWSGIGEAEEQRERIERQLASSGAGWITPQQGIKAFDWLVRHDVTTPTVTTVDWSVVTEGIETTPPFFEDLLVKKKVKGRKNDGESMPATGLISQLRSVSAEERQALLSAFIQEELKGVMRLGSPPSATVSFFDLGMDSLMAVELRNRINRALAGKYTASNTVVFDYPNASDLATYLSKELGALTEAKAVPAQSPPPARPKARREEDAIAIVGMACRFPGAPDIDSFWRELMEGRSAVTEGRSDSGNWKGVLGDPAAEDPTHRRGAFVDGIDLFDSRFFRISPIEAKAMDPQQRMLLETTWHALEDAGIDPDGLKGSRTGVYAGVGSSEYRDLIAGWGQDYSYIGTNGGVTVGRVAYALGLEGPAMPVDMACASSLAAVHQAIVALQRGEVDLALSGGVNVILSPRVTGFLNEMGMLSNSGQCSAFDAAADGFVRGEGCGILVLKRLTEAEADGDRIWGVIRGSAINQNGVSAGLLAPNGPAQERVIEEALDRAGIAPGDIDYLEAHGIGSEFGDPIEMNAAATVFGRGRDPARPLLIGSVKTNIGHLEWASGIAGLIKTILAMRHGEIPPHLNLDNPNPLLEWDKLPVRVTTSGTEWPVGVDRPPLAAVNTFGLSGTNAHVVVEGYEDIGESNGAVGPVGQAMPTSVHSEDPLPSLSQAGPKVRSTRLLPLSGKSPEALRELAGHYLEFLDKGDVEISPEVGDAIPNLADIAWTAAVGRSHFDHRAGVVFSDLSQLQEQLEELAKKNDWSGDQQSPGSTTVAFAYTGHDNRWPRMCKNLYETEPILHRVLDNCDDIVLKERGISLLDVMFGNDGQEHDLGDPALIQAAGYALECALTALWSSVGINPGVVIGSGPGEISAAHAAGVISLEEGLRLAWALGERLPVQMGPDSQSIPSGLENALKGFNLNPPSVTIINGVNGHVMRPGQDPDFIRWQLQDKDSINRANRVRALAETGVGLVIEMGPDSDFGTNIQDSWPVSRDGQNNLRPPLVLTSLRMPSDANDQSEGTREFTYAVSGAYEAGLSIDFTGLFVGEKRRRVALPSYPFQRRRHWVDAP